jgi:outer membrane lipoprotein
VPSAFAVRRVRDASEREIAMRVHARFDRTFQPSPRVTACGLMVAALALGVGGCATVPAPLQGQFATMSPASAVEHDATGQAVRWGGTIAVVETQSGQTCFQLVGRALSDTARPVATDRAAGRFLACRQGFYEPQVFRQGRSLTVTGHVVGYETRKVGEYDYREPKVAADVVYLWPPREEVQAYVAPAPWWYW